MEKERTKRPKRIPLGTRNVLTAPKREGYTRRFVNDQKNRIKDFEAAGYSIVREDIDIGDAKAGKGKKIGSVVGKPVGGDNSVVLMEIKDEWYKEDQKAKQDKILTGENDMKQQLNSNKPGTFGGAEIG